MRTLDQTRVLSVALLGLFFVGVGATRSVAQQQGERVRVTTVGDEMIGVVSGTDDTGFSITFGTGGMRQLSYDEISSLERSLGTRSYVGRGFMIGAGAGVAAGIALGLATSDVFSSDFGLSTGILAAAVYGAGGGGTGALNRATAEGRALEQHSHQSYRRSRHQLAVRRTVPRRTPATMRAREAVPTWLDWLRDP